MNDTTRPAAATAEGTYRSPLPISELTGVVPGDLQVACDLANEAALMERGRPDTCVVTSHALAAYLRLMGREPWLVRIEAHAFPRCRCESRCHGLRCTGSTLGWDGDGTRRRAAGPGMWHGHLGINCDGHLLDPTIDQVNTDLMQFPPLVIPLPPGWDEGASIYLADASGTTVSYRKYHRQVGWKSAGDARPSHWLPIVNLMVALAEARVSLSAKPGVQR